MKSNLNYTLTKESLFESPQNEKANNGGKNVIRRLSLTLKPGETVELWLKKRERTITCKHCFF